jgi:hypothetical protein
MLIGACRNIAKQPDPLHTAAIRGPRAHRSGRIASQWERRLFPARARSAGPKPWYASGHAAVRAYLAHAFARCHQITLFAKELKTQIYRRHGRVDAAVETAQLRANL